MNRRKFFGNFIFGFICSLIVVLSVLVYGGSKLYQYLNKFNQGSDIKPNKVTNDNAPVNILLMGVDIGDGNSKNDKSKRTDTLMLINYKYSEGKVNIISIPRDTLIQVNGKNEKINAAHVLGGVPYVIESVEQLLGVKVNYYSKINYEGFRAFIDAIGGVDIKIENTMNYDDDSQNLHIHFNKGEVVHLNGEKAEEFFRWRKNNNGTGLALGDIDRIDNQHEFIAKVFEKLKSPSTIQSLPQILEMLPNYIETNMEGKEILKYGLSLKNLSSQNFNIKTVKGDLEYIDGVSYFIYDEKKSRDVTALLK